MKKENIQSRNRKLSAKARKKHSSFPMNHQYPPGVNPATHAASLDMLKPLEKMYGYNAMGMAAAAGMSGMSGMGGMAAAASAAVSPYASYATLGHAQQSAAAGVSMSMAAAHAAHNSAHAAAQAAAQFGSAAAGMHHMTAGSFAPSSFGGMVSCNRYTAYTEIDTHYILRLKNITINKLC